MTNLFTNGLKREAHKTKTLNGRDALDTTFNSRLDLFSTIGALRYADEDRIKTMVWQSYNEDPLYTLKIVLYGRDIRGGLGERKVTRFALRCLADWDPELIKRNMDLIPYYGRWDDYYSFIGTKVESHMWKTMQKWFEEDVDAMKANKPISLLAKWIKNPNGHSKETKYLGIMTAHNFGYKSRKDVKRFTKLLVKMRRVIDVTEVKMSANEWNEINYERVPSRAAMNYRNAFIRHDKDRYEEYISEVQQGIKKINASVLYPSDIVHAYIGEANRVLNDSGYCIYGSFYANYYLKNKIPLMAEIGKHNTLEAQWKALPNYVNGEHNIMTIADFSGSMAGDPMETALALAVYFAERNKGAFHDLFMSFSNDTHVHQLKGNSLIEKLFNLDKEDWGSSTNLDSAFRKILEIGVKSKCTKKDMPKAIMIISDMEINPEVQGAFYNSDRLLNMSSTIKEKWESTYSQFGYDLPTVVYWNVNSIKPTFLDSSDSTGVAMVSGKSASTFKTVIDYLNDVPLPTPVGLMNNVINSERYSLIK